VASLVGWTKRIKQRVLKIQRKSRYLRDELHWKVSHHLTSAADTIIIGKLDSQAVIANDRAKAKLAKSSKRNLVSISHYLFRQRLIYKCALRGVKIVVQPEHYTSKTCSRCLHMTDVGSSEMFMCKHCGIVIDRDANSAKNMVIKSCTLLKA
jgi:putative transposase